MRKLPIGKKFYTQSGQALLIVVLVLAVILVVVLSIASRTTTNVSTTSYNEDSLRAFSAAESGAEQSLLIDSGIGETVVDSSANVKYSTNITNPGTSLSFNHPEPFLSGQSRTFWLVSHDASGNLTCGGGAPCSRPDHIEVCWGTPSTPNNTANTPAIEVTLLYDTSRNAVASPNNFQNIKATRLTSDPSSSRRTSNNFQAGATCSYAPSTYAFSTGSVDLTSLLPSGCAIGNPAGCLVMAKVKMLYNATAAHPVGISVTGSNATLPSQGIQIDSTGTAGDSVRKVSVFRSYSEPQSVFDAGVFSLNDLTK